MSHRIKTGMQKAKLFRDLGVEHKLCDQCPLKENLHIEYKLILKMTDPDPNNRPTAEEIQSYWLPLLQHEIVKSAAPVRLFSVPRQYLKFMTLVALFH